MPLTSHFADFLPPNNSQKWNHAQYLASQGEQVLLARILQHIKSPTEIIKSDRKFRWVHRLADALLSNKMGGFSKLNSIHEFRAPIAKLGYRQFKYDHFEGEEIGWESFSPQEVFEKLAKKEKELKHPIPKKFIGIGMMDENWGWLSTYFLNRTVLWSSHLLPQNNLQFFGNVFPEEEISSFLNDPKLLMLLVNQHHNVTHEKVLSIPLGANDPKLIWTILSQVVRKDLRKDKVINTAGSDW